MNVSLNIDCEQSLGCIVTLEFRLERISTKVSLMKPFPDPFCPRRKKIAVGRKVNLERLFTLLLLTLLTGTKHWPEHM